MGNNGNYTALRFFGHRWRPPPVITESTADQAATTHRLCCSCAMCFAAAASSENAQGSMKGASLQSAESITRATLIFVQLSKQAESAENCILDPSRTYKGHGLNIARVRAVLANPTKAA
jgi:hypothetical protein